MKRTATALLAAIACGAAIGGCAPAAAEQPQREIHAGGAVVTVSGGFPTVRVMWEPSDLPAPQEPPAEPALEPQQGDFEPVWNGDLGEAEYEPEWEDCGAYSAPQSAMGNPGGLNSFGGVNEYNGKTETFYANHAVYDDQLTVDDDGFFRDSEGRYVVASSDYPIGTEIEISQGTAIVMDDGADHGIVDVHTTWGR